MADLYKDVTRVGPSVQEMYVVWVVFTYVNNFFGAIFCCGGFLGGLFEGAELRQVVRPLAEHVCDF